MPRWRLTNAHYLNVSEMQGGGPVEWEYIETSRDSGRRARKLFKVPLYLDPANPADHNYPGEIIVAHEEGSQPRDLIFKGPPTPDMEPLDDAAEKLSEEMRAKGAHPIESLDGNYGAALAQQFEAQLNALTKAVSSAVQAPAGPLSQSQVSPADFEALRKQVEQLMAENAALREAKPEPSARRA